jgi:hypothetical protein
MKHKSSIKCFAVVREFQKLGFWGRSAFLNVCRSIDETLDGFDLIILYDEYIADDVLLTKLEMILERLKFE